jgi:hypothetical protein
MNRKTCSTVCFLALLVVALSGCAGVASQSTHLASRSSGTVTAFLTDAPADGVMAFNIEVTGAALVSSSGVSADISPAAQEIEMRHLQLAPTLVSQRSNVPSGNFTALSMTFANPQITLADAQGNVTILNASSTPSVRLKSVLANQPINLELQAMGSAHLSIDFDLRRSLQRDTMGNYVVTPTVSATASTDLMPNHNIENGEGTVISIPEPSSLNLQLRDTGQVVRVLTNASTIFADDAGQFTGIETGQEVEINAGLQSDGSFLATRVNWLSPSPLLCFRGVVTGIMQDRSGNTSVGIVVQE